MMVNQNNNNIKKPNWKKVEKTLQKNIQVLHEELGWFNEEELENTAGRISKFYQEWKSNDDYSKYTTFSNVTYDQLVTLNGITVNSMCAHHMLVFSGEASIAYLPNERVIGVSKLSRIVRKFASRPQIQEGLTSQILEELFRILKPRFLLIQIKAKHNCMVIRGIKESNTKMVTNSVKYDKDDLLMNKNWISLKSEALKSFEDN